MTGFYFKSTLFQRDPGEEVNPGRYGRTLARWPANRLRQQGNPVEEVVPEDWGWCSVCQRKPFLLWVGRGNMDDGEAPTAADSLSDAAQVVWHVFPAAEVVPWKRIFSRIDTAGAVAELGALVRQILEEEETIILLSGPEDRP